MNERSDKMASPTLNTEQTIIAKKMYEEGYPIKIIADKFRTKESTIYWTLRRLRDKGELAPRKNSRKTSPVPVSDENSRPCTPKLASTCVYGTVCSSLDKGPCRYILVTRQKRPCSVKNCTVYEKITKDNPKRSDIV